MNFLKRQIHFTASIKRQTLIGFILCLYLSFIVIVLQPFDTSQFDAEYKTILLAGYGILTGIVFIAHGSIENIWYFRVGKVWSMGHEIISTLLFLLVVGTVLYSYNRTVVNAGLDYTLATYWRFLSVTVICMTPVLFR